MLFLVVLGKYAGPCLSFCTYSYRCKIAGARGLATGGHTTWEPIEGGQANSPDPLVPSNPNVCIWNACIYDGNVARRSSDPKQFNWAT